MSNDNVVRSRKMGSIKSMVDHVLRDATDTNADVQHSDDEKSREDSVENENLAAIDLSQAVARMNRLKEEYWFENELRNLVKRCPEYMNASRIMFRVLKDRIVEEREFEQHLAWLDRQDELRSRKSADTNDDQLPW
jgi:hypothetical protein